MPLQTVDEPRSRRSQSRPILYILHFTFQLHQSSLPTRPPALPTTAHAHRQDGVPTDPVSAPTPPSRSPPVQLASCARAGEPQPPEAKARLTIRFPPRFNQHVLIDTTPLPDSVPPVKEIGATSAPLLSASFFIGARCRDYNDDYMQCKTESGGRGEVECLKEGRRVTRCASSVYVMFPFFSFCPLV